MSFRLGNVIKILKSQIPVSEGTQLHRGFEELSTCHGKTYRQFRSLCGGPVGDKNRRFSPSTVWRFAEADGFAVFEDAVASPNAGTFQNGFSEIEFASKLIQEKSATLYPALNDVRKLIVADGVSLDLPGIYAWKLESIGTYIGKYTRKSRPLREYNKNVDRLLGGEMYRPHNPTGFRRVHHALARAVKDGLDIELHILENCTPDDLNMRERHLIATAAYGGLNG